MKNESYTILEWFEFLPKKLRDRAQAYCMANGPHHPYFANAHNIVAYSLSAAIANGFLWSDTEEGIDFWSKITMKYQVK